MDCYHYTLVTANKESVKTTDNYGWLPLHETCVRKSSQKVMKCCWGKHRALGCRSVLRFANDSDTLMSIWAYESFLAFYFFISSTLEISIKAVLCRRRGIGRRSYIQRLESLGNPIMGTMGRESVVTSAFARFILHREENGRQYLSKVAYERDETRRDERLCGCYFACGINDEAFCGSVSDDKISFHKKTDEVKEQNDTSTIRDDVQECDCKSELVRNGVISMK